MRLTSFIKSFKYALLGLATITASTVLLSDTAYASPPDLEIYAELPRTWSVRVSPGGERLAMLGPYKKHRGIFIYDLNAPNAKPKVIPTPKGSIVKTISWGSDDHILYLATFNRAGQGKMRKFGSRFSRWVSTNVESGKSVIMLDERIDSGGEFSSGRRASGGFYMSRLEKDPKNVLMGWGEYSGKPYFRQFKVNLDTGKGRIARSMDIKTQGVALSPDGELVLARSEYDRRSKVYKVFANTDLLSRSVYNEITKEYTVTKAKGSGEKEIFSRKFDKDTNPTISLVQVIHGEGKVLLYEDELETPRFFTVDVLTGAQENYSLGVNTPSGYDYSLISDQHTDDLVGVSYTDDYAQVIYTAEPYKSWHRKLKKAFPGKRARILSRTKDDSMVSVFVSGDTDPGSYYLYEPKAGRMSPLGSMYPELQPSQIGRTERVNYTARDGLSIPGYITYPPGKSRANGPMPLVALPHGGPVGPRDDAEFDWWAQFIASRGYVVFKPQFRGSGGFGYAHREKGYGEFGSGMLYDTVDGINYLIDNGIVDRNKICVTGGSYGGFQSLSLPMIEPDMFKCAISVNGVSDVVAMLKFVSASTGSQQSGSIKFWNRVIGDYHNDRDKMRDMSAAPNVEKIKAEILVVHGEDDLTVPYEQSALMAKALKKIGQSDSIIELPDDDHSLSLSDSRRKLFKLSEELFAKHLN